MSGLNDQTTSGNPEIFFRAVDRLQLDSYLTAIRQDQKSLVLLSKMLYLHKIGRYKVSYIQEVGSLMR